MGFDSPDRDYYDPILLMVGERSFKAWVLGSSPAGVAMDKRHRKKFTFRLICEKCGATYQLEMTQYRFNSSAYRKHCSRACANGHQHNDTWKENIGKTLRGRRIREDVNATCPICEQDYTYRACSPRKTCGTRNCILKYRGLRLSETLRKNPNVGGLRLHAGRGKGCYHNDIWLDSTWELRFAKRLDLLKITWERCNNQKHQIFYVDRNGKERKYYPDFFLPDYHKYIEIKGYLTPEIEHKLSEASKKISLTILKSISEIDSWEVDP